MRLQAWLRSNAVVIGVLLLLQAVLIIEAGRFFHHPFRFLRRTVARRQEYSESFWGVKLQVRGGSKPEKPPADDEEESLAVEAPSTDEITTNTPSTENSASSFIQQSEVKETRHASDMLQSLESRSEDEDEESIELRQLITQRANEYLDKLLSAVEDDNNKKLPHPKRLLHFLAPKIPAIRLSPDVNLRIQTARSDIDSGVAAALVGTLAQVCEWFDKQTLVQKKKTFSSKKQRQQPQKRGITDDPLTSVAPEIIKDRRFEQIVECVICGVDVRKRRQEYSSQKKGSSESSAQESPDIEDVMEEEDVQIDEGLDVRDSCRAAWGIAILGVHRLETIGGQKVMDLLIALSLRTRELLLARLQQIKQEDLYQDTHENAQMQTTEERLSELSEELAKDVALAMWTFACVSACTGMKSESLFETCSSLLCQDPVDMRRRAQDAEVALKNLNNIGTNDVVDRLARSEAEMAAETEEEAKPSLDQEQNVIESDTKSSSPSSSGVEKDALLDWLSPNELTDILWALAVHGNTDKKVSKDEIVLSASANALKEIAFDRLIVWLRADFKVLSDINAKSREAMKQREALREEEVMTVEVVDAAALLASEKAAQQDVGDAAESITLRDIGEDGHGIVEQLEVVDAQTLLSATPDLVETEVITTSTVVVNEQMEHEERQERDSSQFDAGMEFASLTKNMDESDDGLSSAVIEQQSIKSGLNFSPHDLASIAWAVTELGDSLRPLILELVIDIFHGLGEDGVKNLTGADLSNLAWSVAKFSGEEQTERWSSDALDIGSLLVTLWIAESALRISWGASRELEFTSLHIFESFQPPELSRLVWAVARVVSTYKDVPSSQEEGIRTRTVTFEHLALVALVAAGCNLSMFGAEDLVRISWSFFEICDADGALLDPLVASALGRILATIESSLLRWERGARNSKGSGEDESVDYKELSLFSTFFGRNRGSQPLLNEIIDEYQDFEDDDNKSSSRTTSKGSLPLLKDLPVDPASLCKAACGFARLGAMHANLNGSSTLTRIAVRLLTSKNGRLLRECTLFDLVRVCEAAAIHETLGRGEDLVVGQFSRRVVYLLNTAHSDEEDANSNINLSMASPSLIATLIWSLGELGARHCMADDDRLAAHRRLRLVYEDPLLTKKQLDALSNESALQVLRGLVSMKVVLSDKTMLVKVLRRIESNIESFDSEADLCELAETLCKLKQDMDDEDIRKVEPPVIADTGLVSQDANITASTDAAFGREEDLQGMDGEKDDSGGALLGLDEGVSLEGVTEDAILLEPNSDGNNHDEINSRDPTQMQGSGEGEMPQLESQSEAPFELLQVTKRLLRCVATQSAGSIADWTAQGLQRLLVVLSSLPFQADELVDAIDNQVSLRRAVLESTMTSGSYFQHHLLQAANDMKTVNSTLFGREQGESGMAATLKNGLKSIFGSSPNSNNNNIDEPEADESQAENIERVLKAAAESVSSVSSSLQDIAVASGQLPDKVLQCIAQGTYFELGRCSELIATYHRIEFSTGKHRSRYDEKLTRDIAKRVLSRLLP